MRTLIYCAVCGEWLATSLNDSMKEKWTLCLSHWNSRSFLLQLNLSHISSGNDTQVGDGIDIYRAMFIHSPISRHAHQLWMANRWWQPGDSSGWNEFRELFSGLSLCNRERQRSGSCERDLMEIREAPDMGQSWPVGPHDHWWDTKTELSLEW